MCCVSLKQLDDGHLDPSDQSSIASAGQFEGPRGADRGLLWLCRINPLGGSLALLIQASITAPKDDRYCNLILLPPHVAFLFLTSTNVKIKMSDFPSGPRGFFLCEDDGEQMSSESSRDEAIL